MQQTVYVFDFEGELIDQLPTKECADKYTKGSVSVLTSCIFKGNVYMCRYYFNRDKDFVPYTGPGTHSVLNMRKNSWRPR
jgi:hypothetical protein